MTETERPKFKIVGEVVDPSIGEAERKAEEIIERAKMNEAIRIIDGLIAEVDSMILPERFSPTRKVYEESGGRPPSGGILRPDLQGMTERDFKREQLRRDLVGVRQQIIHTITKLKIVIMDMEATKQDSPKASTSPESPKV